MKPWPKIKYIKPIAIGYMGHYHRPTNTISINKELDRETTIKALRHELSHYGFSEIKNTNKDMELYIHMFNIAINKPNADVSLEILNLADELGAINMSYWSGKIEKFIEQHLKEQKWN